MSKFAISDVEQAFKQLEFAIKLMCYCEREDLDKGKFDSDTTVRLDGENMVFPDNGFKSYEDIIVASQINVGICFGVSAIVLDALFEAFGIKPKPQSRDQKDELRTLVYMVRCAFAHNMAKPCWEVRNEYAHNVQLTLEGKEVSIDLATLHGKNFEYSDIGGFANWYKIKNCVLDLIAKESAKRLANLGGSEKGLHSIPRRRAK